MPPEDKCGLSKIGQPNGLKEWAPGRNNYATGAAGIAMDLNLHQGGWNDAFRVGTKQKLWPACFVSRAERSQRTRQHRRRRQGLTA